MLQDVMTRNACLASLAPTTLEEARTLREIERLRQAIDRKQGVITGFLQALGLAQRAGPNEPCTTASGQPPGGVKKPETKPKSPLESIKGSQNEAKTKLNQAENRGQS